MGTHPHKALQSSCSLRRTLLGASQQTVSYKGIRWFLTLTPKNVIVYLAVTFPWCCQVANNPNSFLALLCCEVNFESVWHMCQWWQYCHLT